MIVSIVTYHTDVEEMRMCLASLDCADVDLIFVIDNSDEKQMGELCAEFVKVRYVPSDNIGFGAAHNIAIRHALDIGADYHLVLNSDVRFAPEILHRLIGYMSEHVDVGVLQPRVVYPDGVPQPTARLLPTPFDVFGRRFLPKWIMRKRNARYTLDGISDVCDKNVPYLQGSFMLLRCSSLREVGLFDERFFMYPEDIDLCRRMWDVARVVRHPAEMIVHSHKAGSYHDWKLLGIHCVNMIKYFCKWGWFVDPVRKKINSQCRKGLFGKNQ